MLVLGLVLLILFVDFHIDAFELEQGMYLIPFPWLHNDIFLLILIDFVLFLDVLLEVFLPVFSRFEQSLILFLVLFDLLLNQLFGVEVKQQLFQPHVPNHIEEPISHHKLPLAFHMCLKFVLIHIIRVNYHWPPLGSVLLQVKRDRKVLDELIQSGDVINHLRCEDKVEFSEEQLKFDLTERLINRRSFVVIDVGKEGEVIDKVPLTFLI